MINQMDTLITLVALNYFKQEFDIDEKLKEISETDWEILSAWGDCQDVMYEDIFNNLLEKIKKSIEQLKGI